MLDHPDIQAEPLSEARLRQIVGHLPFYVVVIDREHRHVWVNRLDQTLDRAHVIGHTIESFCHGSSRTHVSEQVERAFKSQQVGYYEARAYADGEMETWYGVRVVPLPPDERGAEYALLLSTDVTQRHKAEDALRESEARFRMLTESSPDFVIILDRERRCQYVNRDPIGLPVPREQLLGQRIDDWVIAEDRPLLIQSVERAIDSGCFASLDMRGAQTGRSYVARVLPLPPVDSNPRALMVTTDVTEQRAAEAHRRALELRLSQAQKMESIGQLAGGVAHDFNNMIMVMRLHLEAAREFARSGQHDQTRRELDEIETASRRAAELTRQLLAFARRQPHSPRAVRAAEFTTSAVRLLSRLIPASIRLELNVRDSDAWVMADPGLLEQVIMNLCVNARDAIGDRPGMIRVQLSRRTVQDTGSAALVPPGKYLALTVADDGRGIAEVDLPRVFEPFFTTKPTGKGTGLGLSMVHGIVTQHQGFVTVDSTLGEGAVFTLYLPEVAASPRREAAASALRGSPARGRILVAEDEPMVRRLIGNLLRRAGHAVVEAENGVQALRAVKGSHEPFDLMVLDAVMPEMGGKECYERVQELQPGLPAIFSSGYSGDMLPGAFLRERGLQLISKPYDSKTLLDAIDAILQRRSVQLAT